MWIILPQQKKLCKSPPIPCIPHHQYVNSPAIQTVCKSSHILHFHCHQYAFPSNISHDLNVWKYPQNKCSFRHLHVDYPKIEKFCKFVRFHAFSMWILPWHDVFLISPQIASFHHHQYVTCPVTWLFANLLNSLLLQPLVCEFLAQQMCFWISFDSLLQQPPTVCVHLLANWLL